MTPTKFRALVMRYYRAHGRHDLPWRQTEDLYRILVSEVMLQQTQVDRVIPLYTKFMKQFPTAKKLARAPLSEVLKAWQGLGYNRRAKLLHQAAKELSVGRSGLKKLGQRSVLLTLVAELEKLPGIGPYTARAIAAFAYNQDVVVIETNIRTAVIHHFFSNKENISDREIEGVLKQALPKGQAREWYSALMDYGTYLKRSGISYNAKSKRYTKQSKFDGSLRQVRGAILYALVESSRKSDLKKLSKKPDFSARELIASIEQKLGDERREQILEALEALVTEGLVQKKKNRYQLAD